MGGLIPTFQSIINSSTTEIATWSTFAWPFIVFPFAIVAVIAVTTFIRNIFMWLFHAIANMGGSHTTKKPHGRVINVRGGYDVDWD